MTDTADSTSRLSQFLDNDHHWSREVTIQDLWGIDKIKTDDTAQVLGVLEPSNSRKLTYRTINVLNLTAHNPELMLEFFDRQFNSRAARTGLTTYDRHEVSKTFESFPEADFVRRDYLETIAHVVAYIEGRDLNEDSVTRLYTRPHRRLVKMNESCFNVIAGPIEPGGKQYYRGSGDPVRLVSMSANTEDAIDAW